MRCYQCHREHKELHNIEFYERIEGKLTLVRHKFCRVCAWKHHHFSWGFHYSKKQLNAMGLK